MNYTFHEHWRVPVLFQSDLGHRIQVTGPYDTGASMSFLDYQTAKQLDGVIDWNNLVPFNHNVVDSSGKYLDVHGIAALNCIISGRELIQDFVIANIAEPLLLGLDFIHKYNASWDLKQGRIQYLDWDEPYVHCFAVSVRSVIPSKRLSCLRVSIADRSSEGSTLSVDPKNVCPAINICPGVSEVTDGETAVWVENLSSNDLTLDPERFYPIGEVISPTDVLFPSCAKLDDNNSNDSNVNVPEALHEMISRIEFDVDNDLEEKLEQLVMKHRNVFALKGDPLGKTNIVQHSIRTEDVLPIKQAPRRVPIHQEELVESNMESMIKEGVIQPSESPWASPIVLVKKKDGTCRFCIDYRRLNDVTIKDAYPLPRIEDNLDCLSGSKYFTTLDLKSGYWQVEMADDSKEKTAFASKYGLYEWNVMPFGLTNAPATFQRLMEKVLSGLQWKICALYIDDVIVMSNSIEQGIERLDIVLGRLSAAGLKLKPSKCDLMKRSVTFLGHVVDENGIHTDPAKVEKIANWPTPTDLSSVRSFLGLASYYRKFVKSFASIASPLTELSKKNMDFSWDDRRETAFQAVKDALVKSTALTFPTKDNNEYILDTDASAYAIGGVLSQVQEGVERPLAFASRCLNDAEKNYCVTRRELLAVVYYITKEFRHYLLNAKVKVRTDHGCLIFLKTLKNPCGQMARWIERMAPFEWSIEYRPGSRHGNADAMSRRLCDDTCKQCNKTLAKEAQSVRCLFVGPKKRKGRLFRGYKRRAEDLKNVANIQRSWDKESLIQDTKDDPVLSILLSWKSKPPWDIVSPLSDEVKYYRSIFDNWKRDPDGLLWYRWLNKTTRTFSYKLIVPRCRQQTILSHCHDSPVAGHFGEKRSIFTLQRLPVFWYRFKHDMRMYCRTCDDCLRCKPLHRKGKAAMASFQVGEPLQRMAIDIAGPFHESSDGNKFIMVVMDYFTKWAELIPIPNHTAKTCAEELVLKVFARIGIPRFLHSDQGRDFLSKLFSETCKLFQVERTRTTPWRPQSNGMVERLNRTVASTLKQYVNDDQTDWDKWLPLVAMAYNGSVHSSTGHSPFYLMYGRPMMMPLELVLPTPDEENVQLPQEDSVDHFIRKLLDSMRHVFNLVRTNLGRALELQKRQYNKKRWLKHFYPGQGVWLYNPRRKVGRTPKLDSGFEPYPYAIVQVIGGILCEIQRSPRCKSKIVHCDKLEPVRGPYDGQWVFDLPTRQELLSFDENLEGVSKLFVEPPQTDQSNVVPRALPSIPDNVSTQELPLPVVTEIEPEDAVVVVGPATTVEPEITTDVVEPESEVATSLPVATGNRLNVDQGYTGRITRSMTKKL